MKRQLIRLHLLVSAHPNAFLGSVGAFIFFARLSYINLSLALAVGLLTMAITIHAFLPERFRLSEARLVFASIASLMGTSILFAVPAEAITLGGIATSMKNDLGSIYDTIVYVCYGVGFTGFATGINNGIKKSRGDQQVTNGHIFGYGLGGPALASLGYMMDSATESMGGSSSTMNKLPGGLQ
ncbi:hypothetical protein [Paraburkholderia hospita]|uniref:hypothetical protein n=1 Tax=Paraburkholderia hospita TaxID=169430 RepID=UPI0008A7C0F7|nr:hypothetical protein [Paraburkholderia hospita]SEI14436.1 hypothetical protein SAMN05192544_102531 [Paraburkholderia hospita]